MLVNVISVAFLVVISTHTMEGINPRGMLAAKGHRFWGGGKGGQAKAEPILIWAKETWGVGILLSLRGGGEEGEANERNKRLAKFDESPGSSPESQSSSLLKRWLEESFCVYRPFNRGWRERDRERDAVICG